MDSKITMDSIITTLGQIGAASQDDETAAVCQDAVRILYAISEEGAKTPEEALDIIHDYRLQAKQDAALRQKHAVAGKPFLGVHVYEKATAVSTPVLADVSIPFVVGAAPAHSASDPAKANVPVLATNWDEAVAQLGFSYDWKKYPLSVWAL